MYDQYVRELVQNRKLPGAVLHIAHKGKTVFQHAYGGYTDNANHYHDMRENTVFDVASLTKVMATLPAILKLIDDDALTVKDPIQFHVPEFEHPGVTVEHALTHATGMPADLGKVYRDDPRDILGEVLAKSQQAEPGKGPVYSDLGMIILGHMVERITGQSLDDFTASHVFQPWGMGDTQFNPSPAIKDQTAATEMVEDRFIHGEVHDEKAYHLGGISGHAGLFSTAEDVARFGHYWLYPNEQRVLSSGVMNRAITPYQGSRGYGFEIVTGAKGEELSCGRRWSAGSYGHTGFTGTSLWVDPKEQLVVVFLSNIVHFGRKHDMGRIRPHLHALIHSSFTHS
ncbi:serine hydrolase [Thalassobacillus sp. CUG 92003]|uniref:serine hydrolase domain-containing protein n=1 Tax=Thalassobacillus sp. CUG 92003 TaxID=2736641 RepID=UPI0015E66DC3|nr:serine hydrolase domain-containing protein [Thalassobacillus sp. CUG 92003]